jgi:hypothetical protein
VRLVLLLIFCGALLCGLVAYIVRPAEKHRVEPFDIQGALDRGYPVPRNFNSPEMNTKRRKALLGDNVAAVELSEIYTNCSVQNSQLGPSPSRPSTRICNAEFLRWLEVAASHGEQFSQESAAEILARSKACGDIRRGRTYLEARLKKGKFSSWQAIDQELTRKEASCRL